MARAGDMRGAQVNAKVWNRKMTENVTKAEDKKSLLDYKKNFGEVYGMMQKEDYDSASEGEEAQNECV